MAIRTIGVISAGTMGAGGAQVALLAGYDVVILEIKEEFVEKGVKSIKKAYKN